VALESTTAKRLLITSGAHCLHKELWLPILPIGFPGTYMPLDLREVVRSVDRFKLCVHTLRVETAT